MRRNRAAQRPFHAVGFPLTDRYQNESTGFEDCSHSHRQCFARDPRRVAVKQCGVVATCRFGEPHTMRPCGQLVAGFVETDMTVASDAEKLEIDSAGSVDRRFMRSHSASRSSATPFRKCICVGGRFTCANRWRSMNERKLPGCEGGMPANSSRLNATARAKSTRPLARSSRSCS